MLWGEGPGGGHSVRLPILTSKIDSMERQPVKASHSQQSGPESNLYLSQSTPGKITHTHTQVDFHFLPGAHNKAKKEEQKIPEGRNLNRLEIRSIGCKFRQLSH